MDVNLTQLIVILCYNIKNPVTLRVTGFPTGGEGGI